MKPEIDDILVKLYPSYKDLPEVDFINDQDDVYTKDDFWDDLSNKEKYNVNSLNFLSIFVMFMRFVNCIY